MTLGWLDIATSSGLTEFPALGLSHIEGLLLPALPRRHLYGLLGNFLRSLHQGVDCDIPPRSGSSGTAGKGCRRTRATGLVVGCVGREAYT